MGVWRVLLVECRVDKVLEVASYSFPVALFVLHWWLTHKSVDWADVVSYFLEIGIKC